MPVSTPDAARTTTAETDLTAAVTATIQTVQPAPVSQATPLIAATATTIPSPIPAPVLCSPLQDIPFETLGGMISNPYNPPKPGYDDPHAGIDLAVQLPESQVAVAGHPIQAAMAGQVAMVSKDRFPFGNAVIIETPLEDLPQSWQTGAALPTPGPTLRPLSALTCPPYANLAADVNEQRSVYILYAHLKEEPSWNLNDEIACGQIIGSIGESGNALNPHLHFETRAGPSGIRLPAIAHYDPSATSEEMSAYCLWSVSGLFQLVDPLKVLGIASSGQ